MTRLALLVLLASTAACAPALQEPVRSAASEIQPVAGARAEPAVERRRVRRIARLAPPFVGNAATRRVSVAAAAEPLALAAARP